MTVISRLVWIDYIRVVATLSVILLHSSALLLPQYNHVPQAHWLIADIYQSSVRMCVPLFFMISGYLLLEKEEPLDVFFKKRLDKVIIPLLSWSIIYVFWQSYQGVFKMSWQSFFNLSISPVHRHLWFMYSILGIYLVIPILKIFIRNATKSLLYYYIFLWLFISSIVPLIERFSGAVNSVHLSSVSGFSGYLILGLLLGKLNITRKMFMVSGISYLLSLIFTSMATYQLTVKSHGIFSEDFCGWLTPNVITSSISTFIMIKFLALNLKILSHKNVLIIVKSISSASLGIYLVHIMILEILQNGRLGITINAMQGHPFVSIPITAMAIFLISYAVTVVLKQLPVLKRTVP